MVNPAADRSSKQTLVSDFSGLAVIRSGSPTRTSSRWPGGSKRRCGQSWQSQNVQIEGLGSYVPKKTVSVSDSVQMAVDRRGPEIDEARLARLLRKLYKNLGSVSRQWSEDPVTDRPVNWLIEAFSQALDSASWQRTDVDVIIHTGIVRGVIEPSAAAVYSNLLGTFRAQGAQLADALIKTGSAKKVALISTISSNCPYLTESYKITSWDQIGYKVAGMTVGSAASVTLIGGGHEQDWGLKVTRIHDSSQVALCMINEPSTTRHLGLDSVVPQEIKDDYLSDGSTDAQFYSLGSELFALQLGWFGDVVRQALAGETEADVGEVVMTHSAMERQYADILKDIGIEDRHFNIHAKNGNLADNTAPVALKQAIEEGRVKGGMRVSYLGQASGASTALASFTASDKLVAKLGSAQNRPELATS
ncbi:hypothetical protein KFL_000050270 [Klebsormidium nitens]|uniref:Beta-ketoacyl-[acyl-carrier-protein] synthase III C-terminal domain-containing protein n=1 Tax=Klebsormidium nitens TaxID=105231 RepID=A0A1Y1HHF0_KLENI|nr:hypothetical protein KFL_000050270 [Klebsormidium nitens]|eukprot:GAQ77890.1 hypothetical protein KFL_000050270 [Klebsormidium nitens]